MTWLKALRGLWVITYNEGVKIGGVQEVFIDRETKKLAGLSVKSGTLWQGETRWLPVENIKKIGEDVIFIPKEEAALKENPAGDSLNSLLGMTVDSKDGKRLGKLTNILINKSSGEIKALCLASQEKVEIDRQELVLGKDLILVQAGVNLEPCQPPAPNDDTLKSDIGDLVSKYTSGAVKQGEELAQRAAKAVKNVIYGKEDEAKVQKEDKVDNDRQTEKE